MALQIPASLRRKRPVFSRAEKEAFVEAMLLERWEPAPVPLTEAHLRYVEACAERDRLQQVGREAEERLATLDKKCAADIKKTPAKAGHIEALYRDSQARQRAQIDEVRQVLAELNEHVDWDELGEAEKRYQKAAAAARPAHNAARLQLARESLDAARKAHETARRAVDAAESVVDVEKACADAAKTEAALIMAERRFATVTREVKGR